MEYPKKIMRRKELLDMGFSDSLLDQAYIDKNQRFAWKMDPRKKNSPIVFDTQGFQRWVENQKRIDRAVIH